MGKHDLAYLNLDELAEDTSAAASGDMLLRYDDSSGNFVKVDADDLNTLFGIDATAAEIGRVADLSGRVVNTTADLTLTAAEHSDKIVTVDKADGAALTLPAATGSGAKFTILITTTVTSNATTIKVADADDTMVGGAIVFKDGGDLLEGFEASGTDDTITLDGSTTGGIKGDRLELTDVATNLYHVNVIMSGTDAEVTPFSATVS